MFINRMYQRICRQLTPVELSSSETKKSTHHTLIFAIFDSFKRIFSTLRSWCADLKVMIVNRKNDKVDKVASRILNSSEDTEEIPLNFRKRSKTKKIAPPSMGLQPEALSDVPERISPLTPHEVPLPSPTKEEFEWFKADAQDCNSQNSYLRFPIDIHTHILSYLTEPEDIKNTREVSVDLNQATIECLRTRVYLAKKAIAEIIQFAQFFDREIQRITESTNQESTLVRESILEDTTLKTVPHKMSYHRFKFDVKKWEKLLVDLGTKVDLAVIADKFKEDCRLDLVEALAEYNAEYNIGTQTVQQDVNSPDRFLSRIDLSTISKDLSLDRIERMNEILDEAKSTVKGDFFLFRPLLNSDNYQMLSAFNLEDTFQFFMYVWLVNKESQNCHYLKHLKSGKIHLDLLIGKREGDRILVPKGKGDQQILLRCVQKQYRHVNQGSFEEDIIASCFHMDTVDIKIKNKVLEKIKKAYGNKLVDSVAKKVRKQTKNDIKDPHRDQNPMLNYNKLTCRLAWLDEHFSI